MRQTACNTIYESMRKDNVKISHFYIFCSEVIFYFQRFLGKCAHGNLLVRDF